MKVYSKTLLVLCAGLSFFVLAFLSVQVQAGAAPPALQLTEFPTPTPGPDGRIIYIVQDGDTLWRISAISGVSIDELRGLNNLTGEDVIVPGQVLLFGLGGPAEVDQGSGSLATPLPEVPTPTPEPGPSTGTICVLLYDDVNGDAIRQEEELAIIGGAISVISRSGDVTFTGDSEAGEEPVCFDDVEQGDYNISVAIPDGYNPTTNLNYALKLEGGDESYLDFGAQISTAAIEASPPPEEGGQSPMLGVAGLVLILGGIGLAIFAGRMTRRRKVVGPED